VEAALYQDKDLTEIVAKLKAHFNPTKVYLFGSRAKGAAVPNSDYDLLVVLKDSVKKQTERMAEAYDLLWGRKVSVDIFVYTQDEFEDSKYEFGSLAHSVAADGVEL
jgi:uncharacterized protein